MLPNKTTILLSLLPAACAQTGEPESIVELRTGLSALRAEQAEQGRRLQRLKQALKRLAGDYTASHDNFHIATNYRLHTFSMDYVPLSKLQSI